MPNFKEALFDGCIVENGYGERAFLLNQDFISLDSWWSSVNEYDSNGDLIGEDYDPEYSIVKIYERKHFNKPLIEFLEDPSNLILSWQRDALQLPKFKDYDIIECRNGKTAIFLNGNFNSSTGFMSLNSFLSNGDCPEDNDFDIVKAYRPTEMKPIKDMLALNINKTLIFSRGNEDTSVEDNLRLSRQESQEILELLADYDIVEMKNGEKYIYLRNELINYTKIVSNPSDINPQEIKAIYRNTKYPGRIAEGLSRLANIPFKIAYKQIYVAKGENK